LVHRFTLTHSEFQKNLESSSLVNPIKWKGNKTDLVEIHLCKFGLLILRIDWSSKAKANWCVENQSLGFIIDPYFLKFHAPFQRIQVSRYSFAVDSAIYFIVNSRGLKWIYQIDRVESWLVLDFWWSWLLLFTRVGPHSSWGGDFGRRTKTFESQRIWLTWLDANEYVAA